MVNLSFDLNKKRDTKYCDECCIKVVDSSDLMCCNNKYATITRGASTSYAMKLRSRQLCATIIGKLQSTGD